MSINRGGGAGLIAATPWRWNTKNPSSAADQVVKSAPGESGGTVAFKNAYGMLVPGASLTENTSPAAGIVSTATRKPSPAAVSS
jgi:hypothetical protein